MEALITATAEDVSYGSALETLRNVEDPIAFVLVIAENASTTRATLLHSLLGTPPSNWRKAAGARASAAVSLLSKVIANKYDEEARPAVVDTQGLLPHYPDGFAAAAKVFSALCFISSLVVVAPSEFTKETVSWISALCREAVSAAASPSDDFVGPLPSLILIDAPRAAAAAKELQGDPWVQRMFGNSTRLAPVGQAAVGEKLRPKFMNGHPLSGRLFVKLFLKRGSCSLAAAIAAECREAGAEAFEMYQAGMAAECSGASELESLHHEAEAKAVSAFTRRVAPFGGTTAAAAPAWEELQNRIATHLSEAKRAMRRKSREECKALLHELFTPLESTVYREWGEWMQGLSRAVAAYQTRARGPERSNMLVDTLVKWGLPNCTAVHMGIVATLEEQLDVASADLARSRKAQGTHVLLDSMAQSLHAHTEEELRGLRERVHEHEAERAVLTEQLMLAAEHIETLSEKLGGAVEETARWRDHASALHLSLELLESGAAEDVQHHLRELRELYTTVKATLSSMHSKLLTAASLADPDDGTGSLSPVVRTPPPYTKLHTLLRELTEELEAANTRWAKASDPPPRSKAPEVDEDEPSRSGTVHSLRSRIQALESELSEACRRSANLECEMVRAKAEAMELKEKAALERARAQRLREEEHESAAALATESSILAAELSKMRQQLDDAERIQAGEQQAQIHLDEAKAELAALRRKVDSAEETRKRVQQDLELERESAAELQTQVEALEDQLGRTRDALSEAKRQSEELRKEAHDQRRLRVSAVEELEQLKISTEAERTDVRTKQKEWEMAKEADAAQIKRLQVTVEAQKKEHGAMKGRCDELAAKEGELTAEVEALRARLESSIKMGEAMGARCDVLTKRAEAAEERVEAAVQELATARGEVEAAVQRGSDEATHLRREITRIEKQLAEVQTAARDSDRERREALKALARAQAERDKLATANTHLADELEKLKAQRKVELEALRSEMSELSQQHAAQKLSDAEGVAKLKEALSAMTERCRAAEGRAEANAARCKEMEKEAVQLRDRLETAKDTVGELQQAVKVEGMKVKQGEEARQRVEDAFERSRREWETERDGLQRKAVELAGEVASLKERNSSLEVVVAGLRAENARLDKVERRLRETEAELVHSKDKEASSATTVGQLTARIEGLEGRRNKEHIDESRVRAEVEQRAAALTERVRSLTEQNEVLKQQVLELRAESEAIRAEQASDKELLLKARTAHAEVKHTLERTVGELRGEVAERERQVKEADEEKQRLRKSIERHKSEIVELESKLASCREDLKRVKEDNVRLQGAVAGMSGKTSEWSAEKAALTARLRKAEDRVASEQRKVRAAKMQLTLVEVQLQRELAEKEAHAECEEDIAEHRRALEANKAVLDDLRSDAGTVRSFSPVTSTSSPKLFFEGHRKRPPPRRLDREPSV